MKNTNWKESVLYRKHSIWPGPGKTEKRATEKNVKRIIHLYLCLLFERHVSPPTSIRQSKNEPGTALFEKWYLAFFFKEPSFIHKDIHIISLPCMDIGKLALVTSTLELSTALLHLKNKVQPVQHLRCCTVCPQALFPTLPSSTSENPSILAKLCPIYSCALTFLV